MRDDPDEIDWGIRTSLSFSDLVVTSGGLGPTFDDMTVESIAKSLKIPLVVDQYELEKLKERYTSQNLEVTEARLKMVKIPSGSRALHNPIGAAPGVLITVGEKRILILPGVPKEMEALLDSVLEELKVSDMEYYEESFPLEGIMESALSPLISKVMKTWEGRVYVKSHPHRSEIANPLLEVQVYSSDREKETAIHNVRAAVEYIKEHYPEYVGK